MRTRVRRRLEDLPVHGEWLSLRVPPLLSHRQIFFLRFQPPCKRLWCTTAGGEQEGCRTQHMPWADGTPCGRGRWCRHGSCVSRDAKTLEPVDGQWGPWQE